MTAFIWRALRLAAITAFASAFQLNSASAQATKTPAAPSLADMKTTVPAGEVVHVTDTQGNTIKAVLGTVTSDAIELTVDGKTHAVPVRQVQRIRWQQHDTWLTGAVIGAGIGAIPGVYYLMSDPNECAGLCPEEYALVGVGALVGGLEVLTLVNPTLHASRADGGDR